ncbi:uncharacterized protein MELLADRAFT_114936 [Melampsora larici-populina 98AG31]|uniref:F-box domain-containing protein n=1 Tax=Melampsora larici-populina (strain 98AG31 / pathotype 3-4-7) TaxID=747676 RepID=F4R4J6_MELLP|nr:uncharacterized protein MELLADRAFT_114936 [Melampsora larici-populina 98AG31]EGG12989.1 hypothetical protein MELLADRAFT_114936 [Melampsora larici-populina 98AG31]
MSSNALLQEAVLRAAHQHDSNPNLDLPSSPNKSYLNHNHTKESSNSSSDTEDLTITTVHTPVHPRSPQPGCTPISSRPTSPTFTNQSSNLSPSSSPQKNKSKNRVGLKAKRAAAAKLKANSFDPLLRLPQQISIRIFELIGLGSDGTGGSHGDIFSGVRDLMKCGLVCQKWKESSTINFIWFKLYSSIGYSLPEEAFATATWTRKDSKIDWSSRYRLKHAVIDDQPVQPIKPPKEGMTANQLKHKEWDEGPDGKFANKLEARAYYKELGGRKSKNKNVRTYSDRTGWDTLEQD